MSRLVPGVEIELDRVRRVRFTLNTIINLEDKFGQPFAEIFPGERAYTFRETRTILTEALRDDDPEITEEAAGKLMDMRTLPIITEAFGRALSASMPEPDSKNAIPAGGIAPSPGPISGPTGG
jgi:hypothetical protein